MTFAAAIGDRYTLGDQIGHGGMATVYRAWDVRHKRNVALKVLDQELTGGTSSERFLREIRVAAGLQHPHILPIHDSGESDGRLWYVMPLVEGQSLRDRLRRERQLGLEEALAIVREVGDALSYAHAHGVIHRDIKPENILLSEHHAHVADFGIAAVFGGSDTVDRLTGTGVTIGTPAYMSPEQVAGEQILDGRSDLYSLGCILYEMLSGAPPFTGASAQAIWARHAIDPVPVLRTVRPDLPIHIDRTVRKALAKIPADRHAGVAEFIRSLQNPQQPERRIRWHMATVGTVLILVLSAVTWSATRISSSTDTQSTVTAVALAPQTVAVLYFQAQGDDPNLPWIADGITENLIDTLRQIDQLNVRSTHAVESLRGSLLDRSQIARLLGADVVIEGTVERVGDLFRIRLSVFDGPTGVSTPPDSMDASVNDLPNMRGRLATGVLQRLRRQSASPSARTAWLVVQQASARIRAAEAARRSDSAEAWVALNDADSLLLEAEALDPEWKQPSVYRASVAHRRALLMSDRAAMGRWVEIGVGHATRALDANPDDTDALEIRGRLKVLSYMLSMGIDSALRRSAQADLERAVRINPKQAGAFLSLSRLYRFDGSYAKANSAAEAALKADPFLPNADQVMWDLFSILYSFGNFQSAETWCQEAQRRFAGSEVAVRCQLYLLTMPGHEPDIPTAWLLADSLVTLTDASSRQDEWQRYERLLVNQTVAAVIARAARSRPALADSARNLALRSEGTANDNAQISAHAAFVYATLGDRPNFYRAIRRSVAGFPQHAQTKLKELDWWYRDFANDGELQRILQEEADTSGGA